MRDVRGELRRRLQLTLGCTRAPRSTVLGPSIVRALRSALPRPQPWLAGVPALQALRLPAGQQVLTAQDVVALYRLLRLVWLAEMVFGDKDLAHEWLGQPKIRLYGMAPALLAHNARQAGMVERWLVDIDEGNGP